MRKKVSFLLFPLLTLVLILTLSLSASASGNSYYYENSENGNRILYDDGANLLSEDEEDRLYDVMYEISAFGHVAFVSITRDNYSTVEAFASAYYHQYFAADSGTIFLIDMDKRKICIFSDGLIYRTITSDYADTITDNVYSFASDGDYYTCAYKAYSQILTLLSGGRIAQPMKYICNLLLALISAILLLYAYIRCTTLPMSPGNAKLMEGLEHYCRFTDVTCVKTHTTRRYDPPSSGDSDSGGGGGSSGGGGSHSF